MDPVTYPLPTPGIVLTHSGIRVDPESVTAHNYPGRGLTARVTENGTHKTWCLSVRTQATAAVAPFILVMGDSDTACA